MKRREPIISLGSHLDGFIASMIAEGRYKDGNAVIRAGLELLEQEEAYKLQALRAAIQEGLDSGIAEDFDPDAFLVQLHGEWDAKGIG
ncbi:MAG: type II toxin-antitoxin system ParD family antitoxin [Alistipes sp.]|jgi:antitoxin ParD1/3/4|nr:type II toxin-antitoxin system ParD family antitoxin [Alistipes sp.]